MQIAELTSAEMVTELSIRSKGHFILVNVPDGCNQTKCLLSMGGSLVTIHDGVQAALKNTSTDRNVRDLMLTSISGILIDPYGEQTKALVGMSELILKLNQHQNEHGKDKA